MRVTILGCGGSGGVPTVGNEWGSCNPSNPKNRRRRVSILVEGQGQTVIVDTSPDLREQLLAADIGNLDAVLYTHDHADHSHGIDDLRFMRRDKGLPPIPCYGTDATMRSLAGRFSFAFEQSNSGSGILYKPYAEMRIVDGPFRIGALEATPFRQDHGHGTWSTGYRIGNMAYSTDVVALPEEAWPVLDGLDLWVVDALRWEPHPTHTHFDQTLEWIARARPKHAVLTHMNHSMDYDEVRNRCPVGVEPGYDGLVLELPDQRSSVT
jgi:phosphoribosyl 1,2-cyclic phosphate phosphodiesterase